jgi:hypothetical protein
LPRSQGANGLFPIGIRDRGDPFTFKADLNDGAYNQRVVYDHDELVHMMSSLGDLN